jgi:hypothetical protein
MAGELELYLRIPSLSSVADTEVYVYYGNAGAAEANDADTWNPDYGVVYHLKEDPAGTAPQAKDSTVNAVHGTYDIAGATALDNILWGGRCILFDNGPRLLVADNPGRERACDRVAAHGRHPVSAGPRLEGGDPTSHPDSDPVWDGPPRRRRRPGRWHCRHCPWSRSDPPEGSLPPGSAT